METKENKARVDQEQNNELGKTRYLEEAPKSKKTSKKFSILQTITLLGLTLLLSTGGGVALGNLYFWNGVDMKRVNEQLAYYEERVRINPSSLEDRIVLGYTHYLKGNNNQAVNEFKYVLELDENYFDAYYNLGLVYLDEKKYYEALSMFNKTVDLAPKDFKGHVQMGTSYRHLKMYDQALESYSEANRLAPGNVEIIYQIGIVAEELEDYAMAAEIYKDALNYDPLYEMALVALERVDKAQQEKVGDGE
jgi:tetratricopeptide (TPR) repeat protein